MLMEILKLNYTGSNFREDYGKALKAFPERAMETTKMSFQKLLHVPGPVAKAIGRKHSKLMLQIVEMDYEKYSISQIAEKTNLKPERVSNTLRLALQVLSQIFFEMGVLELNEDQ